MCNRKVDRKSFEVILEKYRQLIAKKFDGEKVQSNVVFKTSQNCFFYSPIFLPDSKIVVLFLNDEKDCFSDTNALFSGKQYVLQNSEYEVKVVTMSRILGFQVMEGLETFDDFELYKEEVVEEIFEDIDN